MQSFSSPVATAEFSKFAGILSAALSKYHLLGFEIAQLESITCSSFVHNDASYGPLDFTFQNVRLYMSDHTIVVIWVTKIFFE